MREEPLDADRLIKMLRRLYFKLRLKPCGGRYQAPGRACPVAMLALDAGVPASVARDPLGTRFTRWGNDVFGEAWRTGFELGFDGDATEEERSIVEAEKWLPGPLTAGFAVGRKVRDAIMKEQARG